MEIPSYLVKGLEFDAVIIHNANRGVYDKGGLDARLLYVSITHVHHDLHLFYSNELSPLLAGYEIEEDDLSDLLL